MQQCSMYMYKWVFNQDFGFNSNKGLSSEKHIYYVANASKDKSIVLIDHFFFFFALANTVGLMK